MINRRAVFGGLMAVPIVGTLVRPALAAEPAIFSTGGVAINGYDPVAYFKKAAAVVGLTEWRHHWQGADWLFASQENLQTFMNASDAYAPQFGGYCAYAVSKGGLATTDPDAWSVYEGKLYLNFNTTVRSIWREDIPGNIARANANWPQVLRG